MPEDTQSQSDEVWWPTEFVAALVVVVHLVAISSILLVLLPILADLEQVYALHERLWQYLQLSTSHSEPFLHSTRKMGSNKCLFVENKRTDSEISDLGNVLRTSRKLAAAKNFFAVDL
jgi:hypothetical protein